MRAYLTGVAGQDGFLLSALLKEQGYEVFGSIAPGTELVQRHPLSETANVAAIDIRNRDALVEDFHKVRPNVVFHLAGVTTHQESWQNPQDTFEINVNGFLNVVDAAQSVSVKHFVNASTVEIFAPSDQLINEQSPKQATSPYSISKLAIHEMVIALRERGMCISNAILSNHESPLRDERFVTGKIAHGVAAIVRGELEYLTLGNLDVEKDWSAATDIVDGLARISSLDVGTDIILASGHTTALHELVAAAFAAVEIGSWAEFVRIDESLIRNNEPMARRFDVSRAANLLGWSAKVPVESWMGNMVKAALKA